MKIHLTQTFTLLLILIFPYLMISTIKGNVLECDGFKAEASEKYPGKIIIFKLKKDHSFDKKFGNKGLYVLTTSLIPVDDHGIDIPNHIIKINGITLDRLFKKGDKLYIFFQFHNTPEDQKMYKITFDTKKLIGEICAYNETNEAKECLVPKLMNKYVFSIIDGYLG